MDGGGVVNGPRAHWVSSSSLRTFAKREGLGHDGLLRSRLALSRLYSVLCGQWLPPVRASRPICSVVRIKMITDARRASDGVLLPASYSPHILRREKKAPVCV